MKCWIDFHSVISEDRIGSIYKNKVDGVMHACGHDVRTAMLPGAAKLLSQLKVEHDFIVLLQCRIIQKFVLYSDLRVEAVKKKLPDLRSLQSSYIYALSFRFLA